jgi:tRNA modification GTPase
MKAFFRSLTADGRGAFAVVRIWGPGAVAVVDSVFRTNRGASLGESKPGRLRLGRAGLGVGDEVVGVRIDVPTPTLEIHCHGGAAAVAAVIRSLEEAGAVRADADPAAVFDARDRIRASALARLAAAPTLRVAEILLDQVQGALTRSLERLVGEARRVRALERKSALLAEIDALIRSGQVGTRLLRGWKVVITGRPNVGKSRLFNALAGFERSIVNPRPGVTRDVVSFRTAFGGWPVELCDTAGERDSADFVEQLGMGRARQERRDADVVMLVLDRSEPLQDVDRHLLQTNPKAIIVANKCDVPPAWISLDTEEKRRELHFVSAQTGDGIDGLVREMEHQLVPNPPAAGVAVPILTEYVSALEAVRASLTIDDLDAFIRRIKELGVGDSPI